MYKIVDLGALPGGGPLQPSAINNAGVVVGRATDRNGVNRAVRRLGSAVVRLDSAPEGSSASDVNDSLQIVGKYSPSSGNPPSRPCRWSAGNRIDLPTTPSGDWGEARGINNSGVIVGALRSGLIDGRAVAWKNAQPTFLANTPETYYPFHSDWAEDIAATGAIAGGAGFGGFASHAVRWEANGQRTLLDPQSFWPQWGDGDAKAINGSELAVGYSSPAGKARAMLWNGPAAYYLAHPPGFDESTARDISSNNEIVGAVWNTSTGAQAAAHWIRQTPELLNALFSPAAGWNLKIATGVNDRGQIVGYGNHYGKARGWLLTPAINARDWRDLPRYVIHVVGGRDDGPGIQFMPGGGVVPIPPPNPAWRTLTRAARFELMSIACAHLSRLRKNVRAIDSVLEQAEKAVAQRVAVLQRRSRR
jgi:uncharacterized membrane protein